MRIETQEFYETQRQCQELNYKKCEQTSPEQVFAGIDKKKSPRNSNENRPTRSQYSQRKIPRISKGISRTR